jgi:hypothetical protein
MIASLERADYAIIISLGSLVASLMALGFQLWNALRLDRATLKVTVASMVMVGVGVSESVVTVTVVNQGKRPTNLSSLWLTFQRSRFSHRRFIPRRWRADVGVMLWDEFLNAVQPRLPMTLDVGGEVSVQYRTSVVLRRASADEWRFCTGVAGASTARGRSSPMRVRDLTKHKRSGRQKPKRDTAAIGD